MRATFLYVLLTTLRDRLFLALFLVVLLGDLISGYLGRSAFAEGQAMTLAFAGTAARLALVFGLLVFVAYHVRRLAESREIETMLTRPIGREGFVLAYGGGLAVVTVLLVLPLVVLLALFFRPGLEGLLAWGLSLLLEGLVVMALALFAALALESAIAAVMTGGAIYVLARLMPAFVDIANARTHVGAEETAFDIFARTAINLLSILMPRLDLFSQTGWLVHGLPADGAALRPVLVQAAIYLPLLFLAAMFDLRRKRF
ncbi:MAG: hypothetical protein IT565_07635 [Rhodospirillales bacterium]|nr:hypothetical protein [Rhodospirillales bacterium]